MALASPSGQNRWLHHVFCILDADMQICVSPLNKCYCTCGRHTSLTTILSSIHSFSLIASMLLFSFSCPSGIVERATTFLKRGSKHLPVLCVWTGRLLVVGSSSSAPTWPWKVGGVLMAWGLHWFCKSVRFLYTGCVGTEQNYPQSRRFACCVSSC